MNGKRVLIVGGGFTGLAAAHRLAAAGCDVTIYEAGDSLGGLAAGFEMLGTPLERAYHFLYRTDTNMLALAEELGIADKLIFHESSISTYYDGELYPMMTPVDLLKFKPLSPINRIRAGVTTLMIGGIRQWEKLTTVTAMDWLRKYAGQQVTDVIWEPLLRGKFDHYYDDVTMSWLWGRVKQRVETRNNRDNTEELGYFDGGFRIVVEALAERVLASGGTIKTSTPVQSIRESASNAADGAVEVTSAHGTERFDQVLVTVSSDVASRLLSDYHSVDPSYFAQLDSIDYLDAAVLVFATDEQISPFYWHNVNTPDSPFVVFLSLTALIGTDSFDGKHVYYIGDYVPSEHWYMSADEGDLKNHWYAELEKMFPNFSRSQLADDALFRFRGAQHIVDIGFEEKIPAHQTPCAGVYLANFSQIYPMDRGTNLAIAEGDKLAEQMLADMRSGG